MAGPQYDGSGNPILRSSGGGGFPNAPKSGKSFFAVDNVKKVRPRKVLNPKLSTPKQGAK